MARHQVKSSDVRIDSSRTFVDVVIETELKNPYKFHLRPDVNYPTLEDIRDKLREALTHCTTTFEKVDVSVFKDRRYVSINVKGFINTRFTGDTA